MRVAALASGSWGNCFYIEDRKAQTAVLIDAGISTRQICARLQVLGLEPHKIKGIFITHEHNDHVKGADVFARKFKVPIFATKKTAANRMLCSEKSLIKKIKNNDIVRVGNLQIEAFSKSHSAADPVSYTIHGKIRVSVITDAGHVCKNIVSHISQADFLFIESNHDPDMLKHGPYPEYLKYWIAGDGGHLSNKQTGLAVLEHGSGKLKNIVLSHLSESNNTPELALQTFNSLIGRKTRFSPKVYVSTKHSPTKLFRF